jgi:hypothetical protein
MTEAQARLIEAAHGIAKDIAQGDELLREPVMGSFLHLSGPHCFVTPAQARGPALGASKVKLDSGLRRNDDSPEVR